MIGVGVWCGLGWREFEEAWMGLYHALRADTEVFVTGEGILVPELALLVLAKNVFVLPFSAPLLGRQHPADYPSSGPQVRNVHRL